MVRLSEEDKNEYEQTDSTTLNLQNRKISVQYA